MSESVKNVVNTSGVIELEEKASKVEDTLKGKYLNFLIDDQVYAVEVRYVLEIINLQQVTVVPELPEYINGIINLRGKVIPVMDVRVKFGKQRAEYNERTCIIVVEYSNVFGEGSIGLIVDSVSEVVNIKDRNIAQPPRVNNKANSNEFVKGIGKIGDDVKLIVDIQRLLQYDGEDYITETDDEHQEDKRGK